MQVNSVISINVDRSLESITNLKTPIAEHRPVAVMIQDLPKLEHQALHDIRRAIAPKYWLFYLYTDYRSLSTERTLTTGSAILVHTSKKSKRIQMTPEDEERLFKGGSHVFGVSIRVTGKHEFPFYSVYLRPNASHVETSGILNWILESAKSIGVERAVIMGDFNATSVQWALPRLLTSNLTRLTKINSSISLTSTRGRAVAKFIKKANLNLLNRIECGPTWAQGGRSSFIDLALVGERALRIWNGFAVETLPGGTAHRIIISTTKHAAPSERDTAAQAVSEPELRALSPVPMRAFGPESACSNWQNLDAQTMVMEMNRLSDVLYKYLLYAQSELRSSGPGGSFLYPNGTRHGHNSRRVKRLLKKLRTKNKELSKLKREKARLGRYKSNKNLDLAVRTAKARHILIQLKKSLTRVLNADAENSFESVDHKNQTDENSQPMLLEDSLEQEDPPCEQSVPLQLETAEAEREMITSQSTFDQIVQTKFPRKERDIKDRIEQLTTDVAEHDRLIINDQEIECAMKDLRQKAHIGIEGLKFSTFIKFYERTRIFVHTICKMSFFLCRIPSCCQTGLGKLEPKSGPGEFRIIHKSSPLSSLLEQIALNRLEYQLEQIGAYSSFQYAFNGGRSRLDLVARILENIETHRNKTIKNRYTFCRTTIFKLDIKAAFDSVDQDILLQRLVSELNQSPLSLWIANFILSRKVVCQHGEFRSNERAVCKGVPQGSCLGPILWAYLINKIPETVNIHGKQELLMYADDFFLVHSGQRLKSIQKGLDAVVRQLTSLHLEIAPRKSQVLTVHHGHNNNKKHIEFNLNGHIINEVDVMSILGVELPRKMCSNNGSLYAECQKVLGPSIRKLYLLRKMNVIKTPSEWRAMIESDILNRVLEIYMPKLVMRKTARQVIDDIIMKSVRLIFDWSHNCPSDIARLITGIPPIEVTLRNRLRSGIADGGDHTGSYMMLLDKLDGRDGAKELTRIENSPRRRFHNPDLVMPQPTLWRVENGPIWIIMEGAEGSVALLTLKTAIIEAKKVHHSEYRVTYFNTLALLYDLFNDNKTKNRSLLLPSSSSHLKALQNTRSHDWRIIELRERMIANKWTIHTVPSDLLERMRRAIMLVHAPMIVTLANRPLTEPPLKDYVARAKLATGTKSVSLFTDKTQVAQSIWQQSDIWRMVLPCHVSTMHLMRLSGLIATPESGFQSGTLEPGKMPPGCEDPACQETRLPQTILHRMYECPRYEKERKSYRQSFGGKSHSIKYILSMYHLRKKLFNFMEVCAHEPSTTKLN